MISPGTGGKKKNGSGTDRKKAGRQKRVDSLKGRVEKGIYRVNSKKVAEKMVEDAIRSIRSRDGSG